MQPFSSIPVSGMQLLSSGNLLPASLDLSKFDEYVIKVEQCCKLKEELSLELTRSSLEEIMALFEQRGAEFVIDMTCLDPWENESNKDKSILEIVLEEKNFQFSEMTLSFLFKYYTTHSERAKMYNMNPLHVLARNCGTGHGALKKLLATVIEEKPSRLNDRMSLNGELGMNPVELAIQTCKNEELMNFMIKKFAEKIPYTDDDRERMLRTAREICDSGIYDTDLMGVRIHTLIQTLLT